MSRHIRIRRKLAGMSTSSAAIFVMTFTMIGAGMVQMTRVLHQHAKRSADKDQATLLAESGCTELYQQIRNQMRIDGNYVFDIPSTNAVAHVEGRDVTLGSYTARVLDVETTTVDQGTSSRQYTYTFSVEGRGTTATGISSIVTAKFNGTMSRALVEESSTSGGSSDPKAFGFPVGAIVANQKLDIETDMGFRTTAANGLDAHVVANKGITWNPHSGSKTGVTQPNVLDIQGQWLVPNGVPYTNTVGETGMGNPNGGKNYRNPAAPAMGSFPGGDPNSVLWMPGEVGFADESTVDSWAADWKTYSKGASSHTYSGGLKATDIPTDPITSRLVIRAPAYIDGDLLVNGGLEVNLMPFNTDPKKNVIYVKGNIENKGLLQNLGCTVVFEGEYSDQNGSEYRLSNLNSPFNTTDKVSQRSALISLAKSKEAFHFTTDSSSRTGLIYAAKGGIDVTGSNAEFTGMLLAGGGPGYGDINIHPEGGNSFVVHYDPAAGEPGELETVSAGDITYVTGGINSAFMPSDLYGWVWKK
ncbi:MAG: hypothetical protein JST40_03390 [Armatimonadetes bacterium]|nr:hypothetical protein [Armatimonadota bacterium]